MRRFGARKVGRVPLYLLDTNIVENPLAEDRNLTDRLYGGDHRQRIRQEILLGIWRHPGNSITGAIANGFSYE